MIPEKGAGKWNLRHVLFRQTLCQAKYKFLFYFSKKKIYFKGEVYLLRSVDVDFMRKLS